MREVFPAHRIIGLAVEVEDAGVKFYTKLADSVNDDKVKAVFLDLAEQERDHKKVFSRIEQAARESSAQEVFPIEFYQFVQGEIIAFQSAAFQQLDSINYNLPRLGHC